MNAVTQIKFAKMLGVSRSHITALKKADRLVLNASGNVLVEESRQRIIDTSDPNREDVVARWAELRGDAAAVNTENEQKTEREHKAERMKYDALKAKLDYERAIGKLVERSAVEAAIEDVTSVIRQALEQMPHRTAPELVGKDLDAIRATLKQEIHAALADMEREFTKRLNQMGSEE